MRPLAATRAMLSSLRMLTAARAGGWPVEVGHDPASSFPVSPAHREALVSELTATAARPFASLGVASDDGAGVRDIVEDFLTVYARRPVRDNSGGSGFHNCFWLFCAARVLAPTLVVESGVWRGLSIWLLAAACPDAEVHGFDIDLRRLAFPPGRVRFHEQDWGTYAFPRESTARGLCFFDCHVNQALRVRQAWEKGFRWALFDDDAPLDRVHLFGKPPLPTLEIALNRQLADGERIDWVWRGQQRSYVHDRAADHGVRRLVRRHVRFPPVGGVAGSGAPAFLSLVELAGDPAGRPDQSR